MENFDQMAEQYTPLIHKILKTLNLYKETEEYYQIGLIALWEAGEKYREDKGPFLPFAYSIIKGRMLNQLTKEKRWETAAVFMEKTDDFLNQFQQHQDTYFPRESLEEACKYLTLNQKRWLSGFYKDQNLDTIAKEHSVTKDAVKSWRKSALKKIKDMHGKA
ncbi:sigma-70 family RNA polymerase sigma factor [Peribacillus deserti]|nr:sigma-70 family RNA polymerase sigma factor [Peribacillus deserti]